MIAGGEWTESVDALQCPERGLVECGRAAALFHLDIGYRPVAENFDLNGDVFILRGARVGFGVVPVVGDLAADDVAVIGVAEAECFVFDGRGGGAVLDGRDRLRNLCRLLAAGGFCGVGRGLRMLRWGGSFFCGDLCGGLGVALDEDVCGLGCGDGVLFGWRRGNFRYVFGSEDGVIYRRYFGGQGDGGDHRCLDGAGGGCFVAPDVVVRRMEEGEADEDCGDGDVQQNRAREAAAKLLLEGGGMGVTGHYFWLIGCVTMLMLVMPACLTASMTEANAPKGTASSART